MATRVAPFRAARLDPSQLLNSPQTLAPYPRNKIFPQQPAIEPLGSAPNASPTCFKCGKVGHVQRNCQRKTAIELGGQPTPASTEGSNTIKNDATKRSRDRGSQGSFPLPPIPASVQVVRFEHFSTSLAIPRASIGEERILIKLKVLKI